LWADGRNQKDEIEIIRRVIFDHVTALEKYTEGVTVISANTVNEFIGRFITTRPNSQILVDLRQAVVDQFKGRDVLGEKNDSIIDYCLDVAAACSSLDSQSRSKRVVPEEKQLIKLLIKELEL
jgi:hypothetical protein